MEPREPRNPFYLLLLIIGVIFVLTVLAYALVPVLEEKARDAGAIPPPSPFRDALRRDGWKWVLGEVALLVIVGLMSMGLDRYRRWQRERAAATKVDHPPRA
jgi:hypothetical protein